MVRIPPFLLLVTVAMLLPRPGLAAGTTNDADSPDPRVARIESLRLDGRYTEAADLAEKRLEEQRAVGADDAALGEAASELGLLLWKAGRPGEAEERAREGLALRTRSFGEDGLETAASAHTLGMIVGSRGRFDEAEELLRRALAIRRAALGDASLDVADTLINLGLVLREAGRYDEAAVLLREELVLRRELLGEEHRDVAASLRNLAILFFYQGNWAEAEPLFRRAAAIQRTTLGDSHPELAGTLEDLGRLLRYQGDYADAEAALRESWTIRRGQLGDEHPLTAKTLHTIALCLGDRGATEEAEELHRQTLATLRRTVGDDHPDVPGVVIGLALLVWDDGAYAEAEALFREAAATSDRLFGPTHRSTMFARMSVAGVVYDRGRFEEAEELAREALKEWRATFGDASGAVAHAMTLLGRIQLAQGNAAVAESTLVIAASVYEAARLRSGYGFERATFIRSPYRDLAAARLAQGRETEAWEATERDLARVLADLMISARARPLTAVETAHGDSLARVLSALEEEAATLLPAAAEAGASSKILERCDEVRREVAAARAGWSDYQHRMAKKYPFAEGQVVGLEQVQARLPGNIAIIGWLDVEGEGGTSDSWGWVVRADRLVWVALDATAPGDASGALRDGIAAAAELRFRARVTPRLTDAARVGWDAKVGPLAEALSGAEELVVVPSGRMLGVPIEAFIDERGAYVADRFSVSYAPSATIWAWLRRTDAGGGTDAFPRGAEPAVAGPSPASATTTVEAASLALHVSRSDDPGVPSGIVRLDHVVFGSIATDAPETGGIAVAPAGFQLYAAAPNPTSGSTEIRFDVPAPTHVRLHVYDVTGRAVRELENGLVPTGQHRVTWDGTSEDGQRVSAGIYFYRLETGGFSDTRRVVLLK